MPSIVTVLPAHSKLSKLSYFSPYKYSPGQIVPLVVSGNNIPGLILTTHSVKGSKANIKGMRFGLVKLDSKPTALTVDQNVVDVIKELADYYIVDMAQILELVMPRLSKIKVSRIAVKHIFCVPSHNSALAELIMEIYESDVEMLTPNELVLHTGRVHEILALKDCNLYRNPKYPNIDLLEYVRRYALAIGAKYSEVKLIKDNSHDKKRDKVQIVEMASKSIFSNEAKTLIKNALDSNSTLKLITARKGLSTSTVCGDCGSVLTCKKCDTPLILKDRPIRIYACKFCFSRIDPDMKCGNCGSWKLKALGVGTDTVRIELSKLFLNFSKKLVNIVTLASLGGLYEPSDYTVVVSIDSLFALPDFNIKKEIYNSLQNVIDNTNKQVLLQTRIIGNVVFKFLVSGDNESFTKSDNRLREKLGYPPFKQIIKIVHRGDGALKERFEKFAKTLLKDYDLTITDAFIPKKNNKLITHAIVRFQPDTWPNQKLLRILHRLKEVAEVQIDPINLL